jgi:hypothetical protein
MSNTNMEYSKEELLEKLLDEIDFLLLTMDQEKINIAQFVNEIKNLKNFYENEIY